MRTTVLSLFFLLPILSVEGFEKGGRGTRPLALANAFIAVADDPWMPWHNPAGIGSASSFRSAVCFVPEPFGMKELRTTSAALVLPTPFISVGLVLDDFGSALYRESTALVGIGKTIENGVSVGLAANIGIVSIQRYGTASLVTFDLGVRLKLIESLSLGYCWKNVGGATISNAGENPPQIQTLGVCYIPHRLALFTVDLEKDIRFPFQVRAGIELKILDPLAFRCGCSNNPETFAAGFGVTMAGWECSYAVNTHPQLGLTHVLGISFEIPR